MSVSVWGVEHNEEVSKAGEDPRDKKLARQGLYHPFISYKLASAAKPEHAGKVTRRYGARSFGEALGGVAVGGGLGAAVGAGASLASRGRLKTDAGLLGGQIVGTGIGGTVGGYHGAKRSLANSRKKGWLKD